MDQPTTLLTTQNKSKDDGLHHFSSSINVSCFTIYISCFSFIFAVRMTMCSSTVLTKVVILYFYVVNHILHVDHKLEMPLLHW